MYYILYALTILLIVSIACRDSIQEAFYILKAKAKAKVIKYMVGQIIPPGTESLIEMVTSVCRPKSKIEIDRHDKYIHIKSSNDNGIYVAFDEDLMYKTVGYIAFMTGGDLDDIIMSIEPGTPFLISPKSMGFDKMMIMEAGADIEIVEGDNISKVLNLESWLPKCSSKESESKGLSVHFKNIKDRII